MKKTKIEIPEKKLGEFCRTHGIQTLSLFGSVIRDDFGPESREAVDMITGKAPEDLSRERMLELALIRLVEIVGETAGRVNEAGQADTPGMDCESHWARKGLFFKSQMFRC